jgi:hypothetical protein
MVEAGSGRSGYFYNVTKTTERSSTMETKSIPIILADGKSYEFSERNHEDVQITKYFEAFKRKQLQIIQEVVNPENPHAIQLQTNLSMRAMERIPDVQEVMLFVMSDDNYKLETAYNSFKIKNPGIDPEAFNKLIPPGKLEMIISLVAGMEKEHEDELKNIYKLYINQNDISLKKFAENLPIHLQQKLAKIIDEIPKKKAAKK